MKIPPERILIKLSGEFVSGSEDRCSFDPEFVRHLCLDIKKITDSGIGVSLVVGGGNIVRGRQFSKQNVIEKETADSMGILATVINGLFLRDVFRSVGIDCVLASHLPLPFGVEPANAPKILKFIDEKKVIIFVAGTAIPYFSTDTAAVVNALLSRASILFKATTVDGIYDKDPRKFQDAVFLPEISYDMALKMGIKIMDQSAFAIASAHQLPIMVFSSKEPNCFSRAISGDIKHSICRS